MDHVKLLSDSKVLLLSLEVEILHGVSFWQKTVRCRSVDLFWIYLVDFDMAKAEAINQKYAKCTVKTHLSLLFNTICVLKY